MSQLTHRTLLRHPLASKRYLISFPGEEDKVEVFDLLCRYEAHGPIARGTFGYVCAARDSHLVEEYNASSALGVEGDNSEENEGEGMTPEERYDNFTLVAVKKIPRIFENNQYRIWLCATREIQLMMTLHHPNVLGCTDFFIPLSEADSMSYEKMENLRRTFENVYIVLKKIDYTLREVLAAAVVHEVEDDESSPEKCCPLTKSVLHPLPREYRQFIMYQILKGVGHLHKCRVIHRDLKPENILLDRNYATYITDFGQGKKLGPSESFQTVLDTCTQWYAAPETLTISSLPKGNNLGVIDYASFHHVDVWSIGCLAAELLIGRPLFVSTAGGRQQFQSILEVLGSPTSEDIASILEYRDEETRVAYLGVLKSCSQTMRNIPGKLDDILKSPIDSEEVDSDEVAMIKGCLEWDPKKRIRISDALDSPYFTESGYEKDPEDPADSPQPFDSLVKEEDILDARKGREFLWSLFVRQHPEVGELCKKLEKCHNLCQ